MVTPSLPEHNEAGAPAGCDSRRGFCAQLAALAVGATAVAVPAVAGAVALLNPLRQKGGGGQALRLAALDTLPADGTPRKFPVIAERVDAWTRAVEPVGAVYLRRVGDQQVEALQVICPHAGCTVELKETADPATGKPTAAFMCPCHKAWFDLSGKRTDAASPSPRDLDQLEVELRNGNEVWVKFQNFTLGTPDKVPLS